MFAIIGTLKFNWTNLTQLIYKMWNENCIKRPKFTFKLSIHFVIVIMNMLSLYIK